MNVPLYFLDSLTDLSGNLIEPECPIQILTAYPNYARFVAYGTDMFDTKKIFPDDGRKSFGVSGIKYRIVVIDPYVGSTSHDLSELDIQTYEHPFETAPVLFQDGMLRFRHDMPMLQLFEELEGLPKLDPDYLYFQFIN